MPCKIRTKQFLRAVKTQSKKYRDKLVVRTELVKEVFIEEQRLELGRFRHGERFCNYDLIVSEIQERWLTPETHGLCQEIIHSTSNKINDIILSCIYEVMLEESNRAWRRVEVLEILLSRYKSQNDRPNEQNIQ